MLEYTFKQNQNGIEYLIRKVGENTPRFQLSKTTKVRNLKEFFAKDFFYDELSKKFVVVKISKEILKTITLPNNFKQFAKFILFEKTSNQFNHLTKDVELIKEILFDKISSKFVTFKFTDNEIKFKNWNNRAIKRVKSVVPKTPSPLIAVKKEALSKLTKGNTVVVGTENKTNIPQPNVSQKRSIPKNKFDLNTVPSPFKDSKLYVDYEITELTLIGLNVLSVIIFNEENVVFKNSRNLSKDRDAIGAVASMIFEWAVSNDVDEIILTGSKLKEVENEYVKNKSILPSSKKLKLAKKKKKAFKKVLKNVL